MKKILFAIALTSVLASCGAFSGGDSEQLKAENESLKIELTDRKGYEVDLSNGFEIEFDKKMRVVEIDR